jgi:hypothetical protein
MTLFRKTALTLAGLAIAGAAHAQTVTLHGLRTVVDAPVALVEVKNDTRDQLKYIMVECALFDANGVGLEVRQAAVENIGPGATASGEVGFVTVNSTVGLSAKCIIADRMRADTIATSADTVTITVHHLRIRNIAVMAVFNVTNASDRKIDKVPVTCTLLLGDRQFDTTTSAARAVEPHATQQGMAIFTRPAEDLKGVDATCRVSDFEPRR